MATNTLEVRLSRQEADYLVSAAFLTSEQVEAVRNGALANQRGVGLTLPRELAEQFREAFTEQLAKVGFDEKYDLTTEGQLLEALIDRFHAN